MLRKLLISISLCMTSSAVIPVYAEENDDPFMTLFEYNQRYAKESEEFLSLDDYNSTYSRKEAIPEFTQNTVSPLTISDVKQHTAPVLIESKELQAGTITLQYQTDILGGRPQFLYDRFYLSCPDIAETWILEYSTVSFTGDCISIYFSFNCDNTQTHAWVYFHPN